MHDNADGGDKVSPDKKGGGPVTSTPLDADHVLDYMDVMESDTDKETGLHVLAHAGCCLLFLLELELRGAENGDVPAERTPGAGELSTDRDRGIIRRLFFRSRS